MLVSRYASIANAFSQRFGGPYHDGYVIVPRRVRLDSGGSLAAPVRPARIACRVQVDVATEAMRAQDGFTDKDVRLLILRDGLAVELNTDVSVEVAGGPHAGTYSVQSVGADAMGVYWDCRGRRI